MLSNVSSQILLLVAFISLIIGAGRYSLIRAEERLGKCRPVKPWFTITALILSVWTVTVWIVVGWLVCKRFLEPMLGTLEYMKVLNCLAPLTTILLLIDTIFMHAVSHKNGNIKEQYYND